MHEKATTDEVVAGLLTASRVLVGVAARSLAGLEDQVTIAQFRTLVVLSAHGPLRQGALAELLEVNASTTQRMVDRLEAAGLVDRRPSPRSRREVVVALTQAGADIVDQVTRRRRREIQAVVRRMPSETRSEAVDALRAFAEAAGEPEAAAGSLWGWSLVGD